MSNCDGKNPITTELYNCPESPGSSPLCPDPEPCDSDSFALSGCVVMDKDNLRLGIVKGDRLNEAIDKIAFSSESNAITVEDSTSVDMEGNGTPVAPVTATVKISTNPENVLKLITSGQHLGLEVLITPAIVRQILLVIAAEPDIKEQFCNLVGSCGDFVCNLIQSLDATVV
jgi:hypothetical protein